MTTKYIKEKWKEVRDAKEQERNAEAAICTLNVIKQPDICITNVLIAGVNSSTMYLDQCEHFKENEICENVNCPTYRKNMHYILAHQKHKQLRKKFFQMLFRVRQKQQ